MVIFGLESCFSPVHFSIRGNGDVISEQRDLPIFDEVNSEDDINVFIVQDSVSEIIVEAEENLMAYIVTSVSGDELTIRFKRGSNINNTEPVNVYIRTNDLNSVKLSGSGNMVIENINTSSLELTLSGSGDIEGDAIADFIDAKISGSGEIHLSGEAFETDLKISGSGKMSMFGLISERCQAHISGSGDMCVSVSDYLAVHISGSGSVYYVGLPSIDVDITGSGDVVSYN